MDASYVWSIIVFTGVVTYFSRVTPFFVLSRLNLPQWFSVWLRYVPTAVFGAMIFSEVFVRSDGLNLKLNNISLIAALLVYVVSIKTKSLALSIATGLFIYWVLQNQTFLQLSF